MAVSEAFPVQPTATVTPPDWVTADTVASLLGRLDCSLQVDPSLDRNTRVVQVAGATLGPGDRGAARAWPPDWPHVARIG